MTVDEKREELFAVFDKFVKHWKTMVYESSEDQIDELLRVERARVKHLDAVVANYNKKYVH